MKVRVQRTHQMGTSNRDNSNFQASFKSQDVFQRSFNKSKSMYAHSDANKFLQNNSSLKQAEGAGQTRINPFLGSHNQYESQRFDKNNKKKYKPSKMILAPTQKIFDMANNLNKEVKQIQEEFKDKKINMHKLRELKRTFIKNNREKRNMKPYFDNFANASNLIGPEGMKKLVKQYGFDVNNEEIQLIFKMSNRHLGQNQKQMSGLPISSFVELMTKEDVFFNTLKLQDENSFTFGQKTKHFKEGVHEVLRNKFPKMKQAFKIYRSRNQDIDYQKYQYVMKKMDLTDLIIPEQQRIEMFQKYSEDGCFNVQRFIGDIAEQEYGKRIKISSAIDFSDNLRTNQEKNYQINKKVLNNSLKNMSSLQYQKQLEKATNVIGQLKTLLNEKKDLNSKKTALKQILNGNIMNRSQVSKQIQDLMKKNGINFQKEDYDAFVAYLDFDVKNQISHERVFKNIFEENQKEAQDRFQRRCRNQAPKINKQESNYLTYSDEETALRCINKIKEHKMNPQNRELFNYFDRDKDGYIASEELSSKLIEMNILENWEINALASYLDPQNKGAIDFSNFNKKINKEGGVNKELPFVKTSNSRSFSEWKNGDTFLSSKRNFIKTMNQAAYQRPSQFSAWPERLKYSDLSMIQPAANSGLYASEYDRFTERKQDYGMKQKLILNSIKEKKIQRISEWNNIINAKIEKSKEIEEDRQAARNYALRLTQQKYQENCHRKY